LEEETKRKEEEKKRLDQIHKAKMRELKKKLLDIMLEQDVYNRKINDTIAETAKIDTEAIGVQVNIRDNKEKIEIQISDKEQIQETKKKLTRELERAKADLQDEKKETHTIHKENRRITKRIKGEKVDQVEQEAQITSLEFTRKDLQMEINSVSMDVEMVSTVARKLKLENIDLDNERKSIMEEVQEEMESKEQELRKLDEKYVSTLEQQQQKHEKEKKKNCDTDQRIATKC